MQEKMKRGGWMLSVLYVCVNDYSYIWGSKWGGNRQISISLFNDFAVMIFLCDVTVWHNFLSEYHSMGCCIDKMYFTLNLTAMNWDNSIVLWYTIEENDNHNHG